MTPSPLTSSDPKSASRDSAPTVQSSSSIANPSSVRDTPPERSASMCRKSSTGRSFDFFSAASTARQASARDDDGDPAPPAGAFFFAGAVLLAAFFFVGEAIGAAISRCGQRSASAAIVSRAVSRTALELSFVRGSTTAVRWASSFSTVGMGHVRSITDAYSQHRCRRAALLLFPASTERYCTALRDRTCGRSAIIASSILEAMSLLPDATTSMRVGMSWCRSCGGKGWEEMDAVVAWWEEGRRCGGVV